MKLLFSYLRLHVKSIMLFTVFAVIFCIVFALSNAPIEAVVYAVIICFVLALVIALVGFIRFKKKHKLLTELQNMVTVSLEKLPEPHNLVEEDYTVLLHILFDEKRHAESEFSVTVGNMTDYYTLWAHQIKTPIAAMQLLIQSGDYSAQELEEQLFRIEQYVDMVLQYIRIENSSNDLVLRRQSLDDIIKSCLRKYSKLFIRKKITLSYKDTGAVVLTDSKWLSFVICQLLDNSLKYTPDGGAIKIYMMPDGTETLVIEDNGIGISPEDLPRIFDKGYTGYNGRAEKKSTGIGLYLCRQVIGKLSHTISAESVPQKGTRVLIGLRLRDISE